MCCAKHPAKWEVAQDACPMPGQIRAITNEAIITFAQVSFDSEVRSMNRGVSFARGGVRIGIPPHHWQRNCQCLCRLLQPFNPASREPCGRDSVRSRGARGRSRNPSGGPSQLFRFLSKATPPPISVTHEITFSSAIFASRLMISS